MSKLVALLLSLAALAAPGPAAVVRADERSENFMDAVEKLRSVEIIGGSATGFGMTPGEFFNLSREFQQHGTAEDFRRLLEDENPVVRVMGLVCLAQTDAAAFNAVLDAHRGDEAVVVYMVGCILRHTTVGQLAERLAAEPFFLGREPGRLSGAKQ